MAGLLDLLAPTSDNGGLLDFLKRNTAAMGSDAPAQTAPDPSVFTNGTTPDPLITLANNLGLGGSPQPVIPSATFADRYNAVPNAPQPVTPSGRSFDATMFDPSTYAPSAAATPAPSRDMAIAGADRASPIAVGNYTMPRVGDASLYQPGSVMLPLNAQPTQGQGLPISPVPQQPPHVITAAGLPAPQPVTPQGADQPGFMTAYQNFHNGGGLIGSIAAGITGKRTDPLGQAQQQQAQVANLTYNALVRNGVPAQTALAAVQPGNTEMLKTLLPILSPQTYTQETDKDGNVWNVNKVTGQKTVAYQPKDDKFTHVEVKNPDGSTSVRSQNTKTGEFGPPIGAPAGNADIPGDLTKRGEDYIKTLPLTKDQVTVRGMIDGTIQPPSSFAASKQYWQEKIAEAKQADPTWDENNWAARHKMSVDLASSGNSTMGGILSNGESSFKHLAEYTGSVVDQGNVSHDFPLGGALAHVQNYIGNSGGGSRTLGKIKAINDNLGHYGQESTKFYAGTGGGVEERMNALHEMNPMTNSGEEAAAYAEKEKGLMLDRLNTKLREIKDTYGDEQGNRIIAKHMPDIQKNLKTINDNIDRLRGIKPGAPGSASFGSNADVSAASAASPVPQGWSVKVNQ